MLLLNLYVQMCNVYWTVVQMLILLDKIDTFKYINTYFEKLQFVILPVKLLH